jgi:hypothetical protein
MRLGFRGAAAGRTPPDQPAHLRCGRPCWRHTQRVQKEREAALREGITVKRPEAGVLSSTAVPCHAHREQGGLLSFGDPWRVVCDEPRRCRHDHRSRQGSAQHRCVRGLLRSSFELPRNIISTHGVALLTSPGRLSAGAPSLPASATAAPVTAVHRHRVRPTIGAARTARPCSATHVQPRGVWGARLTRLPACARGLEGRVQGVHAEDGRLGMPPVGLAGSAVSASGLHELRDQLGATHSEHTLQQLCQLLVAVPAQHSRTRSLLQTTPQVLGTVVRTLRRATSAYGPAPTC